MLRSVLVAVAVGAGCGDNLPGPADDAASSTPPGDGSGLCDPLIQNCPAGQGCYWADLGQFRCAEAGSLPLYHPCLDIPQCSPGAGCHLDDRLLFYCTSYCDHLNFAGERDPRCGEHELCGTWDGIVGICLGVCDPRQQPCPDGQGCYAIENGADLCFPVGAGAQIGEPCDRSNDCLAGAQCVVDSCRRLCDFEQFPGGADPVCQIGETCNGPFASPEIGYCQ